jgi:hypothetical protein
MWSFGCSKKYYKRNVPFEKLSKYLQENCFKIYNKGISRSLNFEINKHLNQENNKYGSKNNNRYVNQELQENSNKCRHQNKFNGLINNDIMYSTLGKCTIKKFKKHKWT